MFAKRNFEAENEYLQTRDPSAKQTFGFFIDANNLYGEFKEKFKLNSKKFVLKREGDIDLHENLNTPHNSSFE